MFGTSEKKMYVKINRNDFGVFAFVSFGLWDSIIECHFLEATREMKCSDGAMFMFPKIRLGTGDLRSLLHDIYINC